MRLTQPSDENFIELMSWFSNEDELNIWSGPNFRYPFDLSTFKSDLSLDTLKSFSLTSNEGDLLAYWTILFKTWELPPWKINC